MMAAVQSGTGRQQCRVKRERGVGVQPPASTAAQFWQGRQASAAGQMSWLHALALPAQLCRRPQRLLRRQGPWHSLHQGAARHSLHQSRQPLGAGEVACWPGWHIGRLATGRLTARQPHGSCKGACRRCSQSLWRAAGLQAIASNGRATVGWEAALSHLQTAAPATCRC